MAIKNQEKTVKRTFWGAALFYILIAFEFFYMASPFAIYFYSVYRPALNFFNQSSAWGWLISFFMPHVAQTSSTIINLHNVVGAVLATAGFLAFCIGACQVYYNKLTKKGAVTGGVYRYIRHPQYAAFIICSFGLMLMWPRYIVLMMFNTMLFAYYLLARVEEKECEAKFGESYINYKNQTGMFFPLRISFLEKLKPAPKSSIAKFFMLLILYICVQAAGIGIARGLDNLSLDNLYTHYSGNTAFISMNKIEADKLKGIKEMVTTDEEVKGILEAAGNIETTKYLNYVMPAEWFVPEIPMNGINGSVGHRHSSNYDTNNYKVIFNKVEVRGNQDVTGKDLIRNVARREPIVEVWVNVEEGSITKIMGMPERIMYDNIPVAIY
ncbi:Protein-S-isoprenylcysteine O-methyltransferase Ste14 [Natronincola peptidivorans]|uniref:Protein-S-isoprenylcysteine O-methyltransferase Ste14 n=1 Tax=Natronincola peptidivorans TaxID=426128 RepID=A0A1I0AW00_9FIRM|nr:isoprenylcysteine carboxylmethyltransferase family protein [Natronincola peptidivorans]SES97951.1 Protein-S-isoprenylcysteine O-methyltransferase Ste14 [Natronincola peptidivorans]